MGGGMPQSHKNQTSPSATSASSLYGDTSAASIKSQHHSQSEQDAIHNTIASLYDPSKLPYSTAEAVAAYQQFSYPTLYGRPASIYGWVSFRIVNFTLSTFRHNVVIISTVNINFCITAPHHCINHRRRRRMH